MLVLRLDRDGFILLSNLLLRPTAFEGLLAVVLCFFHGLMDVECHLDPDPSPGG
jgi:hypothetical protein